MPIPKPKEKVQRSSTGGTTAIAEFPPHEEDFERGDKIRPRPAQMDAPTAVQDTTTASLPEKSLDNIDTRPPPEAVASLLLFGTKISAYCVETEKGEFTQTDKGVLLHTVSRDDQPRVGELIRTLVTPKLRTPLANVVFSSKNKRLFYIGDDQRIHMLVGGDTPWTESNIIFNDSVSQYTNLAAYAQDQTIVVLYENSQSRISSWTISGDQSSIKSINITETAAEGMQFASCVSGSSIAVFDFKSERFIMYQESFTKLIVAKIGDTPYTVVPDPKFLSNIELDATKPAVIMASSWKNVVGKWWDNTKPNTPFSGILIISHAYGRSMASIFIDESSTWYSAEGISIKKDLLTRKEGWSWPIGLAYDYQYGSSFYLQTLEGSIETRLVSFGYSAEYHRRLSSVYSGEIGSKQLSEIDIYHQTSRFKVVSKPEASVTAISDLFAIQRTIKSTTNCFVFFVGNDFHLWYTFEQNDYRWLPGGDKFYNLGPLKLSANRPVVTYSKDTNTFHVTVRTGVTVSGQKSVEVMQKTQQPVVQVMISFTLAFLGLIEVFIIYSTME
ncbi:hypothetical protein ABW20_dc0104084 [Dactylellina cionopaga]|nr:hypothetical protein ABW20_dc0104084 [Dactylellina cionopaga]